MRVMAGSLVFPVEVEGKRVMVSPPKPVPLPDDTSDFPATPRYRMSIGEGISSGLWSIVLLVIWNVILLMIAHVAFLRYDVRQ